MVSQNLQSYILYKSHNALGHKGSTKLYNFIKRFYYWKKLCQDCNKYIRSCIECKQVILKEPQYVNLHLPILQFPVSFISRDLLGLYSEMENGNQYTLTIICMLTNYVFMVPIRTKSNEDIINSYLKHIHSTFGGSKYILSDRGGKFTSKQFTWLAKEFIKLYTFPYTPIGNSVIEMTHFSKSIIKKDHL